MGKFADRYFLVHPWQVVEEGFDPVYSLVGESVFSLGNEYTGLRGYFDEGYSGERLCGSYLNGVYESRTLSKSGYRGMLPFTEFMVNTVDWVYTRIVCNGQTLDLAKSDFSDFQRILDLRTGLLTRGFVWQVDADTTLRLDFERFTSMEQDTLGQEQVLQLYDQYVNNAKQLLMNKNHDYDEAWRKMRISSFVDIILMKLMRIKQIENHQGSTMVSEGLDANYYDIFNYAVFAMIQLSNNKKWP